MTSRDGSIGVIFDLDGVLVDTGWAHRQSWHDLAEREGFRMSDEFFSRTFGMQNQGILRTLLGPELPAEQINRMSEWKEQHYRELIADRLALAEGARTLLDDLKGKRFLLAIGSSAPRANLQFLLERLRVEDYFNACVTEEDVREGKPSPETFLRAAEKLSLQPSRCAVVEDAVQGIEAGKAAGMPVVAVTTTRRREDLIKADVIVDSLAELKAEDFARLLTNKGQ